MNAVDDLRAEHEGILRMLGILRVMAARIEHGRKIPNEHVESVIDFLRVFADQCHHGKEEDIFFPELERAGIPHEGGPIGVMLYEHTLGREHIRNMVEAAARLGAPDGEGYQDLRAAMLDYCGLLAQHIAKENEVLFPLAEKVLSPGAVEDLHLRFEQLERERIGSGVHEAFHRLLDELAAEYRA